MTVDARRFDVNSDANFWRELRRKTFDGFQLFWDGNAQKRIKKSTIEQ